MPVLTRLLVPLLVVVGVSAATLVVGNRQPSPTTPLAKPATDPNHVLRGRILARLAVLRLIAAGKMTLSDAASVFGWLNRQTPVVQMDQVRESSALADISPLVNTDADLACLHVMSYCRATIWMPAVRMAEMETEFRRLCALPGGAVLAPSSEDDCRRLFDRGIEAARRDLDTEATEIELSRDLRLVKGRDAERK